ncbi:DUF962 domain-containing protein [Pedomonas mirosovicensis]|uniref:DUF962 domain-containing protein n=1 Tax=Pedomonas mirosovicensis TaxID=2908641 RepID=UPI00216A6C3C|nr:DUF962 domain-containing protein [Pedomonas mirosovicensis]MCH8686112.1 DUF962 domain-containing protein [Pedomonas mirosovicensis]
MAEHRPGKRPSNRIETYDEFFLYYLREHARPATRRWHYAGTALVILAAAAILATGHLIWLPILLLAGYGPAWISHFFIEKNRPATFRHPFWSLISDFRMFGLWLTGRLRPWLERAGVPTSQAAVHR